MKIVDEEDLQIRAERGRNLENIRIKMNYSREKLEEITGIKNIYQKEKGVRPLTNRDIKIISKKIGCLESDLLGETEIYKETNTSFANINKINLNQIKDVKPKDINNQKIAIENYTMDKKFLKNSIGSDNVLILKCNNNCMFPLIEYDDDVFIDLDRKKFFNNGIFLIKDVNNAYVLKRAFKREHHTNDIILNYINTSHFFQETKVDHNYFTENVVGTFIYIGKKYLS
jgi:transcriptional regulator with XRE-family HTH domain